MNVVVTDLAGKSLTVKSVGKITAFVEAIPTSETETSFEEVYYDSNVLENTSAVSWNDYVIQTPLGNAYSIQNLSATQSLISNRISPVGDGGFGRLRVTNGAVSKILKCDTTKRGNGISRIFLSYADESVAKYFFDQLFPMLQATPDLDYYETYDHTTSTYTRNANCWAEAVDLSCVAVASNTGNGWFRQRGGTLITPRHILIAKHYPLTVGAQVRFSDSSGNVETVTVTGLSTSSTGDALVCQLNTSITLASPCSVAGIWVNKNYTSEYNYAEWYSGGLVIHTDQAARIYVGGLGRTTSLASSYATDITVGDTTFFDCELTGSVDHDSSSSVPEAFAGSRHTPVPGDSGQPVFVVIEGIPVLLWTWLTPTGGTPAYLHNGAFLNALIASADASAGVSTGLTVTVAPDPTL